MRFLLAVTILSSAALGVYGDVGCWDREDREQKGSGYRGSQSVTKTGLACQVWSEQYPQSHQYYVYTYASKGIGEHNFCRNPSEAYTDTWCYTTSPDTRWEWCDVPTCAGKPSEDLGKMVNIAGDGTATQSNTAWNGVASRAIDGNIDSNFFDGSCTHTGSVKNGWWNLEFPDPVHVKSVVIYNRMDCCLDRIDGATVYADDMFCGKINYDENQVMYEVNCDTAQNVYNVMIKAAPNQYLSLCEVKVY